MGFYFDLVPEDGASGFRERGIPFVYWGLFLLGGFALVCMGLSSYKLLNQLADEGAALDWMLLWGIYAFVGLFILSGLRLAWVRKFVELKGDTLMWGHTFGLRPLYSRKLARGEIRGVSLVNKRPTGNLAQRQHGDQQYHIRGHWRVSVSTGKKEYTLDRHTDPEALEPLLKSIQNWLN